MSDAYWLLPDGTIHHVRAKHIVEIINHPELFGETPDSIRSMYDVYDEKMPHEGKARIEIMKRVIKRGYVRIREKRNHWIIQVYKLTPTEQWLISRWAESVWGDLNDKYAEITIYSLYDNRSSVVPFRKLLTG